MSRSPLHPSWSGRLGFILATIGAAVGLGNIWKFPYMAGTQGGGAFVLVYLVTIFVIAIPLAASEFYLGRAGGGNIVHTIRHLSREHNRSRLWQAISWIGLTVCFILMSFYAVVAGWVLAYIWRTLSGQLVGLGAEASGKMLNDLLASPGELILWQATFLILVGLVTMREIRLGLERANIIMIPLLFLMLVFIGIYGVVAGEFAAAARFLFIADFTQIKPGVFLAAIGHGFFSVGVGATMLLTYSAYLTDRSNLYTTAIVVGVADTVIALLAGLGIFAIVFAQNLDPAQGPGLIFATLPIAFAQMPMGQIIALVFFVLLLFATWTSGLALMEVPIAWLREEHRFSRRQATWATALALFGVGLLSVFAFNIWSDVRVPGFGERNLFDVKDFIASNVLLLAGGLLITLYASWALPAEASRREMGDGALHTAWFWLSRLLVPAGIFWVLWDSLLAPIVRGLAS